MSPHGTNSRYVNDGCRCERCREAHRCAWSDWMARARQRDPATLRHGENATYNAYACRCPACTEAHRLAGWDRRARRAGS